MALLEALLLGAWSHVASDLYRGVSSLVTLLWQPSCHGGWVASFVVIADGAASTELSSLFRELCSIRAFDMYVLLCALRLCVFLVCTHAKGV